MYSLQKRVSEGIPLKADYVSLRQNKEWLNVCSNSVKLRSLLNSSEFILSKRQVLEYLLDNHPRLVDLLTSVSGDVKLSARRLDFVSQLYFHNISRPDDIPIVIQLLDSLELFDCCQFVLNSIKRKNSGLVSFNMSVAPAVSIKNYSGDIETLVRVLLGDTVELSYELGKGLLDILSESVLGGTKFVLSPAFGEDFTAIYLDLVLELAEKRNMSMYINPKLSSVVEEYNNEHVAERMGRASSFYLSFKEDFLQTHMPKVMYDLRKRVEGTDWDLSGDSVVLMSNTCLFKSSEVKSESGEHYISPFCVYRDGKPLPIINNYLGYVGVYVDRFTLVEERLVSCYNPVVMLRMNEKTNQLECVQMYNINWLKSADSSDLDTTVSGSYSCDYLDYPFSLSNLVQDEGFGENEEEYFRGIGSFVVGTDTYKVNVVTALEQTLRVLLDSKLCVSDFSLDDINLISSERVEMFSDIDGLLRMILE